MSQEIVIETCSFESLKIEPNSGRKEYNKHQWKEAQTQMRHADLICLSRNGVTLLQPNIC